MVGLIEAPGERQPLHRLHGGRQQRLIRRIVRRPRRYYVNVHTTPFPGGAIQGPLHKPD